jgi:L-threonylcarbamoyladenylate synthase
MRDTRVLSVDRGAPLARDIEEAVAVLRAGGLVGLPTETVYGLAARALDPRAVARVFEAKGRPTSHPLIAHVLGESQARALALVWPAQASRLAEAFWPGPLTLVVDRAPVVPDLVAGGAPSLAVRAPSHPVARAVIEALGEPVAAPSANRYQGVSPTEASHVRKELSGWVDLILDAGPCDAGIESTVVDVRGEPARVLRPGAVSMVALRRVVPTVEAGAAKLRGEETRSSPGMQERHYAPRARLVLGGTAEQSATMASDLARGGESVGLLVRAAPVHALPEGVLLRLLPGDPEGYARDLYGALHRLDDSGVSVIVVERVPGDEAWWAVADRLERGAARRVMPAFAGGR